MKLKNYEMETQRLAAKFRQAIDFAKENGEFISDDAFCSFPSGCCGDTCYLLGQYLLDHDISSTYVCGNYYYDNPEEGPQSHAWILINELIVDITADQFMFYNEFINYNLPVYVGNTDAFHKLFEVEERDVHPLLGLNQYSDFRLKRLYRQIMKYIIEI